MQTKPGLEWLWSCILWRSCLLLSYKIFCPLFGADLRVCFLVWLIFTWILTWFQFRILGHRVSIGSLGNILNCGIGEMLQEKRSVNHRAVRFLWLPPSALNCCETTCLLVVVLETVKDPGERLRVKYTNADCNAVNLIASIPDVAVPSCPLCPIAGSCCWLCSTGLLACELRWPGDHELEGLPWCLAWRQIRYGHYPWMVISSRRVAATSWTAKDKDLPELFVRTLMPPSLYGVLKWSCAVLCFVHNLVFNFVFLF